MPSQKNANTTAAAPATRGARAARAAQAAAPKHDQNPLFARYAKQQQKAKEAAKFVEQQCTERKRKREQQLLQNEAETAKYEAIIREKKLAQEARKKAKADAALLILQAAKKQKDAAALRVNALAVIQEDPAIINFKTSDADGVFDAIAASQAVQRRGMLAIGGPEPRPPEPTDVKSEFARDHAGSTYPLVGGPFKLLHNNKVVMTTLGRTYQILGRCPDPTDPTRYLYFYHVGGQYMLEEGSNEIHCNEMGQLVVIDTNPFYIERDPVDIVEPLRVGKPDAADVPSIDEVMQIDDVSDDAEPMQVDDQPEDKPEEDVLGQLEADLAADPHSPINQAWGVEPSYSPSDGDKLVWGSGNKPTTPKPTTPKPSSPIANRLRSAGNTPAKAEIVDLLSDSESIGKELDNQFAGIEAELDEEQAEFIAAAAEGADSEGGVDLPTHFVKFADPMDWQPKGYTLKPPSTTKHPLVAERDKKRKKAQADVDKAAAAEAKALKVAADVKAKAEKAAAAEAAKAEKAAAAEAKKTAKLIAQAQANAEKVKAAAAEVARIEALSPEEKLRHYAEIALKKNLAAKATRARNSEIKALMNVTRPAAGIADVYDDIMNIETLIASQPAPTPDALAAAHSDLINLNEEALKLEGELLKTRKECAQAIKDIDAIVEPYDAQYSDLESMTDKEKKAAAKAGHKVDDILKQIDAMLEPYAIKKRVLLDLLRTLRA